jgi:DNA processing protein
MNTLEGRAWQALAAAKGLGAKGLWRVADTLRLQGRSASWLLRNPAKARDVLGAAVGPGLPEAAALEAGPDGMEREIIVLHPLHPAFPARLRERRETLPLPALLYATGSLPLLTGPSVAVVGRRDAGSAALSAAGALAAQLAGAGVAVVSGHAAGTDAAAHAGALRGNGTTVAVPAEGLARFRARPELRDLMTGANSLLLSPFPPQAAWAAFQAMARNKIVAALADALVVIVSGAERDANGRLSGTFDAALAALKLGIPLFVGAPSSFLPAPAGNAELLRRGARAWEPRDGAAPILEAIRQATPKQGPAQRTLF